ncbi:pilus assembly protein PilY [Variovorax paradoxus]|uniref:Pilus assembly protein PilY n=2 Tax=Variovorax paradoxus TaxID=34073 RepID=A0A5Q0MF98_VARPD|nr:pilus assembly protein PilY [Variovorax paradoxus]
MFVLDNSGSMDFEAQDGYAVDDNCPKSGWNCGTRYGWYAMRSSSVNTQYYNPAITYAARVNADRSKQFNSTTFVDNQSSNNSKPQHETGWTAGAKKFTYVLCKSDICSIEANRTVRIIQSSDTGTVPLPAGHKRTDCGSTTECTAALERQNIANWYEWYRSRALAVSSALGLAMQSYDNKFRVGYTQYNNGGSKASSIVSGVNYFRDEAGATGRKWKTNFYEWIYGINPGGGTPSHNALVLAANYYAGNVTTSITSAPLSSPWKNDPNDLTSGELSCRRAYAIVLSDGAWNAGTAQEIDTRYAATAGSINYDGTPSGNATKFQYDPKGAIGYDSADLAQKLRARNLYIPYIGGSSSNGFADLTARYFWHTDFSGALANNVPTMEGQHNPTFWQNMTTFTIGWGLTPSGEGKNTGLNWGQIDKYNNDWLAGNPVTPPQWATGNLNTGTTDADNARRVDDFIRAGFTGGGRAYSVYSGDDVRRALDNALSSMVGSGNDAGVAVSGNSNEFQTLEGQYKYTTEYQTADNSGDIKAFKLNANGGYDAVDASKKPMPAWSANARMPAVDKRKIFGLSNYDPNAPAISAVRTSITYSTRLDRLPSDFQALLNADTQQTTDEKFVRYLLGEDPQKDTAGTVYRLRKQPIGAAVNSPPVFVGGRFDMGYAKGSVDGSGTYDTFRTRKSSLPPTIFAATNNGKVHVLNAARDVATSGVELAAFMPKGAMASQIDLADPNFRFRYTLDGPLVEHDVYDKNGVAPAGGEKTWRQLVLGTSGRATPFLYGLESPLNETDRTPTEKHFLWEVNNKHPDYLDLAHVTNNPAAGQLDDGTWVMLTGSGHYGATGKKTGLYVTEALTGKLKKFISLPAGFGNDATGGNRGLGGLVAVRDTTRRIVAAYAGDANGNLWRFDLRSTQLATAVPRRLFTTAGGKAQPIYAAPAWQVHPGDGRTCTYSATTSCGAIVVIGTGILLDEGDLATPAAKQALYGIWDQVPIGGDAKAGLAPVTVPDLVAQTIDKVSAKAGALIERDKNFYQVSSNAIDWKDKKGWLLNLGVIHYPGAMESGERVVGDLANLGSSIIATSFLPEDKNLGIESCTATGSLPNNTYVLDALTGKNKYSFDVDGNGSFDFYSIVSNPAGGFTRGNVTSRNMVGQPNEGRPDGKPEANCTNETGFLTGVGDTQKVGDGCGTSRTWRRSWRQVVSPPF